jgi:hypothetical protein
MSKIYVDNPVQSGFAMVPNSLWRLGISLKAKGLFAFLLSFHHGAAPSVAEIETALDIGKDQRQAAFRELVAVKLAGWEPERNASGRVIARRMWISSRPLLLQEVSAQEPGFPARGVESVQEPGFPAAGFSGSMSRKIRLHEPENPAIRRKTNKKTGADPERSVPEPSFAHEGQSGSSGAVGEIASRLAQRARVAQQAGQRWRDADGHWHEASEAFAWETSKKAAAGFPAAG